MLIDGRTLRSDERFEVDLCIIGAGPAGISIAHELADRPIRVAVIESGGIHREPKVDRLGAGESVGYPYHALERARARGIGGSSLHWEMLESGGDEGWIARPLDPIDLEPRPWLDSPGWPFRFDVLEPYYRRAQVVARLGPYAYDAAQWEREGSEQLALRGAVETVVMQRGPLTFSHHVGTLTSAPNISLIHHTTVTRLVTNFNATRVQKVIARPHPSSNVTVAARAFVLATGGIENARMLLLANETKPGGLGNDHDLVGRYFMEKLSARGGVFVPSDPSLVGRASFYASHIVDGIRLQGVVRLPEDTIRREQLNNAILWLLAVPKAFASEAVRSAVTLAKSLRRRPLLGQTRGHLRNTIAGCGDVASTAWQYLRFADKAPEVFIVAFQSEATPLANSRVTLSESRDALGMPRARLDWRIADRDRKSIRRLIDIFDAGVKEAGLGSVIRKFCDEQPPAMIVGNFHHLGTTRMHPDPRQGVVDEHGRVHGMDNLYVAGSSIFPTSGYANPTLTVVALSIKLADHLAGVLRQLA